MSLNIFYRRAMGHAAVHWVSGLRILSHKQSIQFITKDRRHVYNDEDPLNSLMIALQNENVFISNRLCRDEEWILRFVNAFLSLLNVSRMRRVCGASYWRKCNEMDQY
eukprot:483264_1